MTNQEFKRLIKKYLSGKISKDEERILLNEYDLRQRNKLKWDSQLMGEKTDVSKIIHTKIMEKIESNTTTQRTNPLILKIAASLFLLLSIGFYFYLNQHNSLQQTVNQVEIIQPGEDKAFIILNNGNRIALNDLKDGQLIVQGSAQIKKTKDGSISYHPSLKDSHSPDQEVFNTIQTPKGGRYMVLLSDGTKVWLNAFSSLRFPATFSSNKRVVELSGEAYFEVAKSDIPFLVKTDKQETEVLGTHFNIQSYDDEVLNHITLIEGSVKVIPTSLIDSEPAILIPGQQALLTNKLTIQEVNVNEILAWKNGYFQFVESDLETVMRQLARWYDVDIIYKDVNRSKKLFSGRINRNIDIQYILEMLKYFEVDFEIQGKTIIIQS